MDDFEDRWRRAELRDRVTTELPPGHARIALALLIDRPEFDYPEPPISYAIIAFEPAAIALTTSG